jgi:GTP-binding protein
VKPKIADYPFTTIIPNLGVVGVKDGRSFVVADMPGLIKGASEGAGLGLQFLRHIERTRVLVHVVDIAPADGSDPLDSIQIILDELKAYNEDLLKLPRLIAANKMDIAHSEDNLKRLKEAHPDVKIMPISAFQQTGLDDLLFEIANMLDEAKPDPTSDDYFYYKYEPKETIPFEIMQADDGIYEVYGGELERLFKMTYFDQDQSVKRFTRQIRSLGVDQALRDKGVQNGETVRICGNEFEFID